MTDQTNRRSPRAETLAAQALGWVDEPSGALIPPIHVATTFERAPDNSYSSGRSYIRSDNPTFDQPEALLAALEGGQDCALFASGMAAATAVFQAFEPGAHVLVSEQLYWGLKAWLNEDAGPWGVGVEFVDTTELDAVRRAIQPGRTQLIWVETPANPLLAVSDIAAIAEIAHYNEALLAVDSTLATPVLTRPLELGADIVMHSASKYLNGHSDVLAGALVTAVTDSIWERIQRHRVRVGSQLGSFEAWLLLRGMRTLYVRMQRICESAAAIAAYLDSHDAVLAVYYPGYSGDQGGIVAKTQMQGGFGGLLSFRVKGGEEAALQVAAALRLFKRATSLGGVESLVEHRASVEGPGSWAPPDLLRLSVGIEAVDDLIDDLGQALNTGP